MREKVECKEKDKMDIKSKEIKTEEMREREREER